MVGQRHSFGVGDAQAVGQDSGVVCGAAHFLSKLQEERERNLLALPSEARLHYWLHRGRGVVGFTLKAACFQSSVFGSMAPAKSLARYALL